MKTWKIIRIYRVRADTKLDALRIFRESEDEFLEVEFAKEDVKPSLWTLLWKQVVG